PVCVAGQPGPGRERRGLLLPCLQLAPQVLEHLLRVPGPDLPRVDETAVAVVDADEESAQPHPGTLGIGEAADHDLLLEVALDLQPAACPPGGIGHVPALGDDPFHSHAARVLEDLLALADDVVAVSDLAAAHAGDELL